MVTEHDKALQKIKSILTKDGGPVLRFFDVHKPVTISCDVPSTGLDGVLTQEGRPVAYASTSLTEAESRYAQIEKELLAVPFSLERCNQYTYGKKVTVSNRQSQITSPWKQLSKRHWQQHYHDYRESYYECKSTTSH